MEALDNNVKVTSGIDQGESFEDFSIDGDIAIAGVACLWSNYIPGDPNKFIGFNKLMELIRCGVILK